MGEFQFPTGLLRLQRTVQGIIQKLRNVNLLNILDVRVRIKGLQYVNIQKSCVT